VISRRLAVLLAGSLISALALPACGGGSDLSRVQGIDADCAGVGYGGSGKPTKLIVSDLPLKGDSAERSRQMNIAIGQELDDRGWKAGPGMPVAFQACDDTLSETTEWDPALCRSNAQKYAADRDVIGVIGNYNSGCAAIEIPILNQAPGGGVPMVSPGNTLVCLTEGASSCKPNEPAVYSPSGKRNFVRVISNDAVEGAGLASFAKEKGIKRPFVLIAAGDPSSESQGRSFAEAAKSVGLEIAGTAHYDPKGASYTGLMDRVKSSGADAVVLASILEENGAEIITAKFNALGPNDGAIKLLAFDGFAQQATIDNIGPESRGMYVSVPGKVPSALTGKGADFVSELRAAIPENPVEVFAPYAGQATELLLDAFHSGRTRSGTVAQLFSRRVKNGITGSFSITPGGDPSPAPISVQRAGQTFTLAKTITPPPAMVASARGR
jgi:branched-chain amino acid transport system substrate-binding protein